MTRRSSAFSAASRLFSASMSVVGRSCRSPASVSAWRIQLRKASGCTFSCSPNLRNVGRGSDSRYNRTARSRSSSGYFRGAGNRAFLPGSQDRTSLQRLRRTGGTSDILAIPAKRAPRPAVNHLTVEQTRRLLAQPDRSTRQGRRDATLLATLYDTAARVGELVDLIVGDIRLEPPALVALTGKGRKTRHVPLTGNTVTLLRAYLAEHGLDRAGHGDHPLFFNQRRGKLSRGGIAWLLGKYQTKTGDPTLSNADISPHTLRHSKAMHLYEAGVPLPYIRDLLGHVELSTTETYARASTEAKRRALEAAHTTVVSRSHELEDLEGSLHDAAGLTAGLGDVASAGEMVGADCKVAQAGHDSRS